MPEHQEIEWKESWRDEYLKWLCGYANAHGGTLFMGKDDDGKVVGVENSKKLLEDLPNKITSALGIIADVNLLTEAEKDYIEIFVEKYPSLISYRGKYYYRSGSVLREITGKELDRALLKSQGRTWDGVSLPKLSASDLWTSRKKLGRLTKLLGDSAAAAPEMGLAVFVCQGIYQIGYCNSLMFGCRI